MAIDRWRRDTRLSALDEAACSDIDDPADSTLAVLAELRRLSSNQRVALLLHHVVWLSVDEVASGRLGIGTISRSSQTGGSAGRRA